MRIFVTSVVVEDQARALDFYTNILGFVEKTNIEVGEYRWLTVVSHEDQEGTELLLEPNANAASQEFQRSIFAQGIPATMFAVDDIQGEYERLVSLGVEFTVEPTDYGDYSIAIFKDTCGNLIQIIQQ
ncbi:MAG: VOC family protein [Caldilineaceae bacterium]|nr:VOC family protein [Caldilineaceae bacterium]MCY4089657.1 VOC family protein [Caldilineaceae bacterium]MCY4118942.1 VOC family protein [Caldilineaceae bacterium]MDE0070713.1 VOC family protein [Caldilineaceae bacterium]MDE0180630.1 VOC family protein [Caldilineaceae bacterium]